MLFSTTHIRTSFEVEDVLQLMQAYDLQGTFRHLVLDFIRIHYSDVTPLAAYCAAVQQVVLHGNVMDAESAPLVLAMKELRHADIVASSQFSLFVRTRLLMAITQSAPHLQRLSLRNAMINTGHIDVTNPPVFRLTSLHLHSCAIDEREFTWLLSSQRWYVASYSNDNMLTMTTGYESWVSAGCSALSVQLSSTLFFLSYPIWMCFAFP